LEALNILEFSFINLPLALYLFIYLLYVGLQFFEIVEVNNQALFDSFVGDEIFDDLVLILRTLVLRDCRHFLNKGKDFIRFFFRSLMA